ncbi:MAG: hypothetical protein MSJ87_02280 [Firmicutes bacterium]|nr:hypothetical protein [Bacillota bacterium]
MSERRNQSFTPPIVHRDIKPSNIILTEDGRIVLIDLNAARLDDKNRSHDTQLIGTAGFAAPEQYGFAASSPRADLYAAGILMRVLLTGTDANDAMLLIFYGVSLLFVIFCLLIAVCLPSASRGSSQTADSTIPDSSETLPEATDLNCPWSFENGEVSLYLPKLHCTIHASVSDDSADLYFTANNLSWNDENFTRTDSLPSLIRRNAFTSYDTSVSVQENGTRLLRMGSFVFPLPPQYIDFQGQEDTEELLSTFVSVDVQNDYYSILAFCQNPGFSSSLQKSSFPSQANSTLSSWYEDLILGDCSETAVAGLTAYCCHFTGKNNAYFSILRSEAMEGTITSLYDDANHKVISVVFAQTGDGALDERPDYQNMLEAASFRE